MVAGATLNDHLEVLLAAGCTLVDVAVLTTFLGNTQQARREQCLKLKFIQVGPVGFVTWQSGYSFQKRCNSRNMM